VPKTQQQLKREREIKEMLTPGKMTISSDEDELHFAENNLALASAQVKQQKYSEALQNFKKVR
jgi:hypothetical protein